MHSDLLERFKEYLHVLNRSLATINAYVQHTSLFLKVQDVEDIKQITTSMIESWIQNLYELLFHQIHQQPLNLCRYQLDQRTLTLEDRLQVIAQILIKMLEGVPEDLTQVGMDIQGAIP